MKKEVIRFSNVSVTDYRYGGLDHISFSVYEGEVLTMAGTNTSGIKTIFSLMMGMQPGYTGNIFSYGSRIRLDSPLDTKKNYIAVLWAGAKVYGSMGIMENICLHEEVDSLWQITNVQKVREKLEDWLECFGFSNEKRTADRLTEFEKKKLEILMALYANVKVIVLSDIESWCREQDAKQLEEIIARLSDADIAVIIEYDSRYKYFAHFVQRCIPIVRGCIAKTIFCREQKEISAEEISVIITGKNQQFEENQKAEDAISPNLQMTIYRKDRKDLEQMLRIKGITGIYDPEARIPHQADAFIRFINEKWKIAVNGKQLQVDSIQDAVNQRIAFISDNGHIARRVIFENLSPAGNACIFMKYIWKRRYRYREMLEKYLFIHTARRYEILNELTEYLGNQDCYRLKAENEYQLAIARWLVYNPQIVIIFAPFGNNDLASRIKYMKLQHELAAEGKIVIVISCNYGDLSCCRKVHLFDNPD